MAKLDQAEAVRQMLAFARACGRAAHLLLTKADKLSRSEGLATLARVRRAVGAQATEQLFSATDKTGVDEARRALRRFLAAKEPGDGEPSPGQTNPAWGYTG